MAENYIPKFEDTVEHPEEQSVPKFEDTVEHSANIAGSVEPYTEAPGYVESAIKPALKGITFDLSDKAASALNALGKTAIEDSTPFTYENLLKNYEAYKKREEDRMAQIKEEHPYIATPSHLAGSFVGAGKILKGAQALGFAGEGTAFTNLLPEFAEGSTLAQKAAQTAGNIVRTLPERGVDFLKSIPASAAIGGLTGAGESTGENLGKDIKEGAIGGAIAGPIAEQIVAPGLAFGANKAIQALGKQSWAKQIAATIENASKGGTLHDDEGRMIVEKNTQQMASDVADKITDSVKRESEAMGQAFKQSATQRLAPEAEHLNTISSVENTLRNLGFEDHLDALKSNSMNPEQANTFRTQLKGIITKLYKDPNPMTYQRSINVAERLKNSGIINTLEDLSAKAGTDVAQLNSNIEAARSQIDPFIQQANKIIPNEAEQFKWSSELPIEQQQAKIRDLLQNYIEKAGRSTNLGSKGRVGFDTLQTILEQAQAKNPTLGINPAETARQLQNQSYLNSASDIVGGIRQKTAGGLWEDAKKIMPSPYTIAEKISGSKVAQDISSKLLSKDPSTMMKNAQALYSNPKTKKLAEELYKAQQMNNGQKITNATFQIMQNPLAKKALGMMDNEEGQSNISGVVNSEEEK